MKKDRLEILLEDIQGKFELVFEGHAMLNNKIDRVATELSQKISEVDQKIDRVAENLNQKIDRVAADLGQKIDKVADDLSAHRADTEAHPRYRIAER